MDHAADFLVAPDDRIELALLRLLHQVDAVPLQGLEFPFRMLIGHATTPPHLLQGRQNVLFPHTIELQDVLGFGRNLGQSQQQMLCRDELVLHRVRFALGGLQHLPQFLAEIRRGVPRHSWVSVHFRLNHPVQLLATYADLLQDRQHDAVRFIEQGDQQVQRIDLGMAFFLGQ